MVARPDHRQSAVMFVDMFCHDDQLLDAIRARGLSTVLCVGSGVSLEPHALAAAGLQVTVLDISAVATEWASQVSNTPKGLQRFFKPEHVRPGGSLQFLVGDLTDPSICPGPYDVIVERKTLQLFPEGERSGAVSAVVARLSENGLLLTHSHDGRWKPPASRRDPVRPMLERSGLHVTGLGAPLPAEGRVAFSFVSTG